MRQRILATLLHYANAAPPPFRTAFYELKERLLRQHGTFIGHHIQEITKECWGPRVWNRQYGGYSYLDCQRHRDCRCSGTGIFDQRWIRLERWEWCGFEFHRPSGESRIAPVDANNVLKAPDIVGRIKHPNYGDKSRESCLWLYLLTGEWRLLWRTLKGGRRCGVYFWPMMNVQRVVMEACMRLRWQTCRCGRRYPTWGSGWQVCGRCRKPQPTTEIPF